MWFLTNRLDQAISGDISIKVNQMANSLNSATVSLTDREKEIINSELRRNLPEYIITIKNSGENTREGYLLLVAGEAFANDFAFECSSLFDVKVFVVLC